MDIDVVIPYRHSPFTKDQELKYCLRSIEKHLHGYKQTWVIGDMPGYFNAYTSVIPFKETNWYEHLTRNIHEKLMLACNKPYISDPFLYMNDDHFLLQDTQVLMIPYYHGSIAWRGTGKYSITIANTLLKYPASFNFDIHAPMVIYKQRYREAMSVLNWRKPFGFAIKTSYCAFHGIKGEYYPDYKLNKEPQEQDFKDILARKFFSVGDKAVTKEMIGFLEQRYPHKSMYEI